MRGAAAVEWLETNGLGGYASQTVTDMHTRKYHGLLIGSMMPPVERCVFLSTCVETLHVGEKKIQLSMHQYGEEVQGEGVHYLASFDSDPYPTWIYDIDGIRIEKSLFMPHGENAVVLRYRLLTQATKLPLSLEIVPLFAFRGIDELRHEKGDVPVRLEQTKTSVACVVDGDAPVYLSSNATDIAEHRYWYRHLHYAEEKARGYEADEDLMSACALRFSLTKKTEAHVVAHLKKEKWHAATIRKAEQARKKRAAAESRDAFIASLERAADSFIVRRGAKGKTIIAGYHWFSDWGRDTFISLPGLLLARGFINDAKKIVLTFLDHLSDGMIPNRFPEKGTQPEYNTADGTLWMVHAVREIMNEDGDKTFLRKIFPKMLSVIAWHEKGTRHGIGIDPEDGLLRQGEDGVALTWMDAMTNGVAITPRRGKAVELNALWYDALRSMEEWATLLGKDALAAAFHEKADRVRGNFRAAFWNAKKKCLYDCIAPDGGKISDIRPNQIFAVSLRSDLLTKEQNRGVFDVVTKELLTPAGLRSLSPDDPEYCGRYEGDQAMRDRAYHQGTVWAWLMGPYIDASLAVHGKTKEAKRDAKMLLHGFRPHLSEAGIGQLSEIFDGDMPHRPRGCVAQAWSAGEILRAISTL